MKLEKLIVKHPYFCSHNYFSNEWNQEWASWTDFYNEFSDRDIDMNQVFRFDFDESDNNTKLEITMIHQRKGILAKHYIHNITDENAEEIKNFLQQDFDNLKKIWSPLL